MQALDDMFIEEKINGKIYFMARPDKNHMRIQYNLCSVFNKYFKSKKKKCEAIFETQFDIDEDNYLVPDVMVFCYESNTEIPLIVIEVLSKSTRDRDLTVKMKKYAEIGVKEYWLVDYKSHSIDIYILANSSYEPFKSYTFYTQEDFVIIKNKELREKQRAEIIKEFSPVSIPAINIKIKDIFYFVD